MNPRFVFLLAALLIGLLATPGRAADSKPDTTYGDQMTMDYFVHQTRLLNDGWLSGINSLEDWQAARPELKRQLLEMLGLDPLPPRTDLKATITGRHDMGDYTVENLHFQSMPGLYVTANLYLPKNVEGRAPTVLYTCGHARKDSGSKSAYQRHGIWYARNGYVCLITDTLQLGEIEGIHHGTYRFNRWWWWTVGYTPLGVEVWNDMRAIDYLLTRPEVDPERIAKTGRSGGGGDSWYVTAVDERIATAMPTAGMADMAGQVIPGTPEHVKTGSVIRHCDCMFHFNTYRWDFSMVAALAAPRPVLLVNTDLDFLFPYNSVIRLYNKARQVWALHGQMENWQYWIGEGGHVDSDPLRLATYQWIERVFKNEELTTTTINGSEIEDAQLRVFETLPEDQINTRIDELFIKAAAEPPLPETAADWQTLRAQLLEQLAAKTFAAWPAEPEPLEAKVVETADVEGMTIEAVEFRSQGPVRLRAWRLRPAGDAAPAGQVFHVFDAASWDRVVAALRALADDATVERLLGPGARATVWPAADATGLELVRGLVAQNRTLVVIAPRGVGPTTFSEREPGYPFTRSYQLLGQTLDGQRVWDVRRAIQALAPEGGELTLGGEPGDAAGIALYAAIYEPAVKSLLLHAPRASHKEGPILLNVRRFMDMPLAVALALDESREIRLLNVEEAAWHWPAELRRRLALPESALHLTSASE